MAPAHCYVLAVGLCSLLLCDSILTVSSSADDCTKCLYTSCNPFLLDGDSSYWLGCIYPEDLNATKRDFGVQRYNLSRTNSGNGPDPIVLCNWLDQAELKCHIKPGYNISGPVSQTLRINIPDPTPEHEGHYVCIAVGGKYGAIPCQLTLTAVPDIPRSIQIVDRTKSTLTVQWTPGSRGMQRNLTQYFRIRYRKQNKTNQNKIEIPPFFYTYQDIPFADATNFTIQRLESSSLYEVSVLAFNGVGESRFYKPDLAGLTLTTDGNEDAHACTDECTDGTNNGKVIGLAVTVAILGVIVTVVVGILCKRIPYHATTDAQAPENGREMRPMNPRQAY